MYILIIILLSFPVISPLTCNCTVDQDECNVIGTCTTEGLCVGLLVLTAAPFITQKCISPDEISSTCSFHVPKTLRYCCNTDLCNNITALQNFLGITPATTAIHSQSSNSSGHHSFPTTPMHFSNIFPVVMSIAAVCVFIIALLSAVISIKLVLRYCRYTGYTGPHDYMKALHLHEELSTGLDSTYGSGSGSGAGMAQLSQVTIARQVRKFRQSLFMCIFNFGDYESTTSYLSSSNKYRDINTV